LIDGQSLTTVAAEAIYNLLEIDPSPMRARSIKTNPYELAPIVKNYDELVQALRGTEFERFLD
jgi:hypothetical protein